MAQKRNGIAGPPRGSLMAGGVARDHGEGAEARHLMPASEVSEDYIVLHQIVGLRGPEARVGRLRGGCGRVIPTAYTRSMLSRWATGSLAAGADGREWLGPLHSAGSGCPTPPATFRGAWLQLSKCSAMRCAASSALSVATCLTLFARQGKDMPERPFPPCPEGSAAKVYLAMSRRPVRWLLHHVMKGASWPPC